MVQQELFRTSILAKYHGMLVLIEVDPTNSQSKSYGKCPQCGNDRFEESAHPWDSGWTVCTNNECSFAILTAHLKQIEEQY